MSSRGLVTLLVSLGWAAGWLCGLALYACGGGDFVAGGVARQHDAGTDEAAVVAVDGAPASDASALEAADGAAAPVDGDTCTPLGELAAPPSCANDAGDLEAGYAWAREVNCFGLAAPSCVDCAEHFTCACLLAAGAAWCQRPLCELDDAGPFLGCAP